MYVKKEQIYFAYLPQHNSNRGKQVIILMILNGKGWHYFLVKQLSALLIGLTLKNNG